MALGAPPRPVHMPCPVTGETIAGIWPPQFLAGRRSPRAFALWRTCSMGRAHRGAWRSGWDRPPGGIGSASRCSTPTRWPNGPRFVGRARPRSRARLSCLGRPDRRDDATICETPIYLADATDTATPAGPFPCLAMADQQKFGPEVFRRQSLALRDRADRMDTPLARSFISAPRWSSMGRARNRLCTARPA